MRLWLPPSAAPRLEDTGFDRPGVIASWRGRLRRARVWMGKRRLLSPPSRCVSGYLPHTQNRSIHFSMGTFFFLGPLPFLLPSSRHPHEFTLTSCALPLSLLLDDDRLPRVLSSRKPAPPLSPSKVRTTGQKYRGNDEQEKATNERMTHPNKTQPAHQPRKPLYINNTQPLTFFFHFSPSPRRTTPDTYGRSTSHRHRAGSVRHRRERSP